MMEAVRGRIAEVSLPGIVEGGGREPSLDNMLDVGVVNRRRDEVLHLCSRKIFKYEPFQCS